MVCTQPPRRHSRAQASKFNSDLVVIYRDGTVLVIEPDGDNFEPHPS